MLKRNIYDFSIKISNLDMLRGNADTYVEQLISILNEYYPTDDNWNRYIKTRRKNNDTYGFSFRYDGGMASFIPSKDGYKNIEQVILLAESFGMFKSRELEINSNTLLMEGYALLKENSYNGMFLISALIMRISNSQFHPLYESAKQVRENAFNQKNNNEYDIGNYPELQNMIIECLGLLRLSEKFTDRLNHSHIAVLDDTLKNIKDRKTPSIKNEIEKIGF